MKELIRLHEGIIKFKADKALTWVTTTVQAPAAAATTKLAFVPTDLAPLFRKYNRFK